MAWLLAGMAGLCMETSRFLQIAVILAGVICGHVSLSATTNTAIETKWFGLGERECFNHTCKFGQYCSKARDLGGFCRDCEREEMLSWCQGDEKREIFKRDKPSCYYYCEMHDKELLEQQLLQLANSTNTSTNTGSTCAEAGFAWDRLHYLLMGIAAAEPLLFGVICFFYLRRPRNHETRRRAKDPEKGYVPLSTDGPAGVRGNENGDAETDPLNPTAPPAPDNADNGSAINDSGNVSVNSSAENVNTDNTTPMSNTPSASGGSGTRYPTKVSESQQSINVGFAEVRV